MPLLDNDKTRSPLVALAGLFFTVASGNTCGQVSNPRGQERVASFPRVRSIDIPEGWSPLRWSMDRHTLAASEWMDETRANTIVRVYRFTSDGLMPMNRAYHRADRPLLIGEDRLLFFQDRRVVVESVSVSKELGEVDLSEVGIVGEATYVNGYFFFHTIHEYVENPIVRMFALNIDTFQLLELGHGYYPILLGDSEVFFVGSGPEYRLGRTGLPGAPRSVLYESRVNDGPMGFLKPSSSRNEIVCQYGGYPWRIARLSPEGKVLKYICPDNVNAFAPLLSQSEEYVAYAAHELDDEFAVTVSVVDVKGDIMYRERLANIPALSAFGWALDSDTLGVLVPDKDRAIRMQLVDFSAGE